MPQVLGRFDVVLDDERAVAQFARLSPGEEGIGGIGPNGARRIVTDFGIVVREIGYFRILRRRANEGVATGRQCFLKTAIQLLGQYPATIQEQFPASPLGDRLKARSMSPDDNASSSNSRHSKSEGCRSVKFGLEHRLRQLAHCRVLGEEKIHDASLRVGSRIVGVDRSTPTRFTRRLR